MVIKSTRKAIQVHLRGILFLIICLLLESMTVSAQKVEKERYFYTLNVRHGLSDNHILQMLQLPDGRMIVKTKKGIDLYDEPHFRFLPLLRSKAQAIAGYKGQSHLYVDCQNRLWIKDFQQVYAVNLKDFSLISHPLDSLFTIHVRDVFVDSQHEVWGVTGLHLISSKRNVCILLNPAWGELQDMDVDAQRVYVFCSRGVVAAYSFQGKLQYVRYAYDEKSRGLYDATSLVVKSPNGQFYQIRTGKNQSAFLHFDPSSCKYQTLYTCNYILHTLNMSSDRQALISSQRGYLMYDFKMGNRPQEIRELSLPDGTSLTTGINTVYRDHDGGIWLGTYKDGIIYVSPLLGLFFTMDKPWWKGVWGVVLTVVMIVVVALLVYRKKNLRARNVAKCQVNLERKVPGHIEHESLEKLLSDDFQNKVIAMIEKHLSESDYGVERLAKDLCMERTGLYKKLTALTGETPVGMIRKVRLEKAAAMLRQSVDGSMTVNEIAERTGFSSSSYFTKCFKERYGMKPSEYR